MSRSQRECRGIVTLHPLYDYGDARNRNAPIPHHSPASIATTGGGLCHGHRAFGGAKRTGKFYTKHQGRQVRLGDNLPEATLAFHRLHAGVTTDNELSVADVLNLFLGWARANRSARTFVGLRATYRSLLRAINGRAPADSLRPDELLAWANRPDWGPTYRHHQLAAVQRAYAHAVRHGHLQRSPIVGLRKPAPASRADVLTRDQLNQVLGACRGNSLADLLLVAAETGCRPDELRRLEARHCRLADGVAVYPRDEAKGKREPRLIVLTDTALPVVRRLCAANQGGQIFRNGKGRPWTSNAVVLRLQRISRRLGFRVTSYALRHSFATNALAAGIDIGTVAALMGHRSVEMVGRVYGHLLQRTSYLREQVNRASQSSRE